MWGMWHSCLLLLVTTLKINLTPNPTPTMISSCIFCCFQWQKNHLCRYYQISKWFVNQCLKIWQHHNIENIHLFWCVCWNSKPNTCRQSLHPLPVRWIVWTAQTTGHRAPLFFTKISILSQPLALKMDDVRSVEGRTKCRERRAALSTLSQENSFVLSPDQHLIFKHGHTKTLCNWSGNSGQG